MRIGGISIPDLGLGKVSCSEIGGLLFLGPDLGSFTLQDDQEFKDRLKQKFKDRFIRM